MTYFKAYDIRGEIGVNIDEDIAYRIGRAVANVLIAYRLDAFSVDETDGLGLAFENWRFNLRRSKSAPLVRLQYEGKGEANVLEAHVSTIADLLGGEQATDADNGVLWVGEVGLFGSHKKEDLIS